MMEVFGLIMGDLFDHSHHEFELVLGHGNGVITMIMTDFADFNFTRLQLHNSRSCLSEINQVQIG